MELALAAFALEIAADRGVDHGVEDQARLLLDIVEHAVEMAFRAHHRPEMPKRLDILELRQAGARHHVQRLAGRIREEVEVELLGHWFRLWKKMGKSLAEASGRTQGQDSAPPGGLTIHSRPTAEKIHPQHVDHGDGADESAQSRESRRVKLLAKFVRANKPRSASPY